MPRVLGWLHISTSQEVQVLLLGFSSDLVGVFSSVHNAGMEALALGLYNVSHMHITQPVLVCKLNAHRFVIASDLQGYASLGGNLPLGFLLGHSSLHGVLPMEMAESFLESMLVISPSVDCRSENGLHAPLVDFACPVPMIGALGSAAKPIQTWAEKFFHCYRVKPMGGDGHRGHFTRAVVCSLRALEKP